MEVFRILEGGSKVGLLKRMMYFQWVLDILGK